MPLSIFSSRPLALIGVIALLVLGLDRAVLMAGQGVLTQSQFRYARLYYGDLDADIAILGNSRGVHSFYAPELETALCRPVVNLSYNGLAMDALAAIGRDAAERMDGLEVMVIEVSSLFSPGAGNSQLSPFRPASAGLQELETFHRGHLPWFNVFASLNLNSELFYRAAFYVGRSDQSWINRGAPVTAAMIAAYRAEPPVAFSLDADAVAWLDALLDDLEGQGIRTILVAAPYHAVVAEHAPGVTAWPAELAAVLDRPVIDLVTAISGDEGFADPLHLNLDGARAAQDLWLADAGDLERCSSGPA